MTPKRFILSLSRIILITAVLIVTLFSTNPRQAATTLAQEPAANPPTELQMARAQSFDGDLRNLPPSGPTVEFDRIERKDPLNNPTNYGLPTIDPNEPGAPILPGPSAPAPTATLTFDGLDFATWGAGHPPDPNGDVGPTYYIQTINTSIGIYNKTTGAQVAAFTFNTFMSQGNFGNLCDTDNYGDPVVLYDTFEDRWVITDFAFTLDGSGNVINPPGAFECFAVSKTGDPVSGGWNFYSINTTGGLGDYPKLGIWPDGIYMMVNMFDYSITGSFQNPRVYAINKFQLYAGAPTVQMVSFDAPAGDFTLLPSNARLQAGTPPVGTPNYFVSTWNFLNAQEVYKFHVDWNNISLSTFSASTTVTASSSWPNATVPNAPSPVNSLDTLPIRAMVQNQYSNIGGVESLWVSHTVRRGNTTGFAAPRWYQIPVTGGTIGPNDIQAATWDPDGANVMHRYMPSIAVDRAGNVALGYTTSNASTNPGIKYAGQLAGDPLNTFSQAEQTLYQGTGTQSGNCGASACARWGDYSAMTLDPDGCTFWYTNEYYAVNGLNSLTRIGKFSYPSCTPVGIGGTIEGTVTRSSDSSPVSGATITFGSRTTTTNASGFYQFTAIPAGTYNQISASFPGLTKDSATPVVVGDSAVTTQNFALNAAAGSACLTDTTQADFQAGVPNNVNLTGTPGDIILNNTPVVDQQNTTVSTTGAGITISTYGGQTFTPAVSGKMAKVDISLFCSACTGTTPDLTLSLRDTSGGLPTGADLATATITGFSSGAGGSYTAVFASPPDLTAGTMYALVIRPTANPSTGIYALLRSSNDVYAGGTRVSGAVSGTVWSIPPTGSSTTDAGFKVYMDAGYNSPGEFVSALKDANPAAGYQPTWTSLSWTAATPANTSLQFQAAGSNNPDGPFNFVGPDSTAGTYFTTSGASLAQFNGFRYLKYKAILATTDGTVTPTLNDVTVCFKNMLVTATTLGSSLNPSNYASSVTLTAAVSPAPAGGTVAFKESGVDLSGCGAQALNVSGEATCTTSALAVGTHNLTAVYSGDADSNGSTSPVLPQVVDCAAAVTVTNANDSGFGSLRDAAANVCPDGTIGFDGSYTINLLSTLTIDKNLAVDGAGHSITLNGGASVGVLHINTGLTVSLANLHVTNGAAAQGAGLYHAGGTLDLSSSTFSGNTASADGGALYNASGTINVTNSTFAGNTATSGNGGGIVNLGTLTVLNSTFDANVAGTSADNLYSTGTATVDNSIFVRNTKANCSAAPALGGTHNLADDGSCGAGTTLSSAIALGTLGAHGGGTPTVDLGNGSDAIDSGDAASCPALDQRGVARSDLGCDAGAFEAAFTDTDTIVRSLADGQTLSFGPTMAKVTVVSAGTCTSLSVTRTNTNQPHPGQANLNTGVYWTITPAPAACTGLAVTLRLPAFSFTPDPDSKLCRWVTASSSWDCGPTADNSAVTETLVTGASQNYIQRQSVTSFSDWTAANKVGPNVVALTSFRPQSPWLPALGLAVIALLGLLALRRMKQ